MNWFEILSHLRIQELPISAAHALRSGLLALENADPFDRVIAAQALIEGLPVASIEATWDAIGVVRVWNDTMSRTMTSGHRIIGQRGGAGGSTHLSEGDVRIASATATQSPSDQPDIV